MPSFLVDPLLVTVPAPGSPRPLVDSWIAALGAWLAEIQSSPFEWRHSLECTHQLQAKERFPTFDQLRRLILGVQLGAVNVVQMTRALNGFFQDASKDFLAGATTKYAIAEDGSLQIRPGEFLARNDASIRDMLGSALVCLSCDRGIGDEFASRAHLVTMPFSTGEREVHVSAKIAVTDPDRVVHALAAGAIEERFAVVLTPEDLLKTIDIAEMFAAGAGPFVQAVMNAAQALTVRSLGTCVVGPKFWDSLSASAIINDQSALVKLLRTAAGVVAGLASELNVDLRALRTTANPDSPQRTRDRDGARAWRLTLTTRGAGWRLHYWHVPEVTGVQVEQVELANVVRESETYIPE